LISKFNIAQVHLRQQAFFQKDDLWFSVKSNKGRRAFDPHHQRNGLIKLCFKQA